MEEIEFEQIQVGDYIKIVDLSQVREWDVTYFKVEEMEIVNGEIGGLKSMFWVDYKNNKFNRLTNYNKKQMGYESRCNSFKYYKLTEKEFHNLLDKDIILGSL